MTDWGGYLDLTARIGRINNRGSVAAGDTVRRLRQVHWFGSVGAEAGLIRRFDSGLFVEPQLQYMRVGSDSHVDNLGAVHRIGAIDSLIARGGLRLGMEFNATSEHPGTVYVKGNLHREFKGEGTTSAADCSSVIVDYVSEKGTWSSLGYGFSLKVRSDAHAYVDVEHGFGRAHNRSTELNAGLRVVF